MIMIGQQVRHLRTQKGISLNELASLLNVSSGYLSNLETGKTDTISLEVLEKLQNELHIFPEQNVLLNSSDPFTNRIHRVSSLLHELNEDDTEKAEFLLSHLEQGLSLFLK